MPKPSKSQPANVPSAKSFPGIKDPILSAGPPQHGEDWRVKNARAKALVMSTLVPGSEPWKIAEPLELASDIWKALEARYAPRDAEGNLGVKGSVIERLEQIQSQANKEAALAVDTVVEPGVDREARQRKEAMAHAAKELHTSMPNRDQRFLWALLHGGKEETNAWFYGIDDPA